MRSYLVPAALALTVAGVSAQRQATVPATIVTIEGCLQDGAHAGGPDWRPRGNDTSPAGAGDLARDPDASSVYLLTDVRTAGTPGANGAAGTATTRNVDGSVVRGERPRTFALVAPRELLARFMGRRVAIEGMVIEPARVRDHRTGADPRVAAEDAGVAPPVDDRRGAGLFDSRTERLRVSRVRQVAPDCARARP